MSISISETLKALGLGAQNPAVATGREFFGAAQGLTSVTPVTGETIGAVGLATEKDYEAVMKTALSAFEKWRAVPAPRRGEVVRLIGMKFRERKDELGALVSIEMGKSLQEGKGEVQEIIDICDFAVGLSRQMYGNTMFSERPNHRMYEQWHPLGVVGVITAFNFPVAVWAWNAMIAMVCGNVSVWKPSEKTPLTAVACFRVIQDVLREQAVPEGVLNYFIGQGDLGARLSRDVRVPLVSATGSVAMGRKVAVAVGERLGRSLLELGGNNALILTENADLSMALPTIVFGAVGTAGQRCTSTRRLLVHESLYEKVKTTLVKAYGGLRIGSPLDETNHVGPLIDKGAVEMMQKALRSALEQGGRVVYGGEVLKGSGFESGCYVTPALVEARADMQIVQEETFAPILYLIPYSGDVSAAIQMQNNVRQGLSSAIFTRDMRQAEQFLSPWGSDCGIANVNLGTSGAEIGGAFGGEKETGGGRESGSDAWKAYMRRQTNTINFGASLPLAQGIKFELS
jgi:aldehyde dehydrogenase (NAD+)